MTSCAATDRILGTLAAYGTASGGYVGEVGYATLHGERRVAATELPDVCWVALGRSSQVLRSLFGQEAPVEETSPILDALTTADAVYLCDLELRRLEAEGKLVIASVE